MPESIADWASSWSDNFNQSITQEELQKIVGKKVKLSRPDTEDGKRMGMKIPLLIVGYSTTRLFSFDEDGNLASEDSVFMHQLLTSEGNGLPLFADMTIDEDGED